MLPIKPPKKTATQNIIWQKSVHFFYIKFSVFSNWQKNEKKKKQNSYGWPKGGEFYTMGRGELCPFTLDKAVHCKKKFVSMLQSCFWNVGTFLTNIKTNYRILTFEFGMCTRYTFFKCYF